MKKWIPLMIVVLGPVLFMIGFGFFAGHGLFDPNAPAQQVQGQKQGILIGFGGGLLFLAILGSLALAAFTWFMLTRSGKKSE